ncbi:MAG: TspO/MBR family protein [Verrucomicrobiota bacterium]|nr:TspO/MBR family protein [Verrucomicrobiota bacterium]
MNSWYQQLEKPPLTPPGWVFGPVWTVLYILILISIVLWVRSKGKAYPVLTSAILVVHLAANFVWTPLFFGMQSPLLAFIDILLLDATLIILIYLFRKSSLSAAYLLLPYLAWVSFATYLNLMFVLQ